MEFKDYDASYRSRVVKLLNVCFPENQITENSFDWKHNDKFFNGQTHRMIAVENETVCAFVCFTPYIVTNGTETKTFYLCAVQATHPEFRRRGLVSQLTQTIEEKLGPGTSYIGFSNESGVQIDKHSKKINYQILGQLRTKYVITFPYRTQLTINKVENFLNIETAPDNYFHLQKNASYFDWRYSSNPKNDYQYFQITNNNETIGYIIAKERKDKFEVSEILLVDNETKLWKTVIQAFSSFAIKQGKTFVSYSYLNNKFWSKCFPFLSISKTIPVYFTVKTADSDLLNAENWIIQGGDIQ